MSGDTWPLGAVGSGDAGPLRPGTRRIRHTRPAPDLDVNTTSTHQERPRRHPRDRRPSRRYQRSHLINPPNTIPSNRLAALAVGNPNLDLPLVSVYPTMNVAHLLHQPCLTQVGLRDAACASPAFAERSGTPGRSSPPPFRRHGSGLTSEGTFPGRSGPHGALLPLARPASGGRLDQKEGICAREGEARRQTGRS